MKPPHTLTATIERRPVEDDDEDAETSESPFLDEITRNLKQLACLIDSYEASASKNVPLDDEDPAQEASEMRRHLSEINELARFYRSKIGDGECEYLRLVEYLILKRMNSVSEAFSLAGGLAFQPKLPGSPLNCLVSYEEYERFEEEFTARGDHDRLRLVVESDDVPSCDDRGSLRVVQCETRGGSGGGGVAPGHDQQESHSRPNAKIKNKTSKLVPFKGFPHDPTRRTSFLKLNYFYQ